MVRSELAFGGSAKTPFFATTTLGVKNKAIAAATEPGRASHVRPDVPEGTDDPSAVESAANFRNASALTLCPDLDVRRRHPPNDWR